MGSILTRKQETKAPPPSESGIQTEFYTANIGRFSHVFPNMELPGWRECDILAITKAGIWYEYEIKLSRSDFKADAKKTLEVDRLLFGPPPERCFISYGGYSWAWESWYNKYERVTKYSQLEQGYEKGPQRFFYIVPEGLLQADDVPDFAGLIYYRPIQLCRAWSEVFTEIKPAPRLHKAKVEQRLIRGATDRMLYRYWDLRRSRYYD